MMTTQYEHYQRLMKLKKLLSRFQSKYLIETAFELQVTTWQDYLNELIDYNNDLTDWEGENL